MPLVLQPPDTPKRTTNRQYLMVIPAPRQTTDSLRVFLKNTETPLEIEGKKGDGNFMVAGF